MADNAFSRLLKVISLERRQGYRNKAVIGGMDKFASRWEPDARAESPDPLAVNEIVALLIGYPAVEDTAARERIIDQIVRRAKDAAPGLDAGADESTRMPPVAPPRKAPAAGPELAETPGPPAPPTPPAAGPELAEIAEPAPPAPAPVRAMPARSKPEGPPVAARPVPAGVAPGAERTEELPPQPSPRSVPRPAPAEAGLDAPITRLPGVGPALAAKLARLGVHTVRDLLYLLPYRYDDFSRLRTIDQLHYGEQVTIVANVWNVTSRLIGAERRLVNAEVGDGTGAMEMTWFNPFVERRLRPGQAYTFSGEVNSYRGRLLMRNPEFEPLDRSQIHTGRLVPIYPLTEGITVHWLRAIMSRAVESFAATAPDFLPAEVRQESGLLALGDALTQIHFPDNTETLSAAHRRLSFDEFLILQLGVLSQRQRFRRLPARPLRADPDTLAPFLASLPFTLTGAQGRALAVIADDLAGAQPMGRLLQGDVGSGKTAVAAAALWAAVANGAQGAIMAPTEILAEQHAHSFEAMFAGLTHPLAGRPVRVGLITGRLRRSEREALLADLASGQVDVAVGTHALIQEDVAFRDLAVVVVDEQHRFGVEQRAALRQRGGERESLGRPRAGPTAHARDERHPHPALAGPHHLR